MSDDVLDSTAVRETSSQETSSRDSRANIRTVLKLRQALKEQNDDSARGEKLWSELIVALETVVMEQEGQKAYSNELGEEITLLHEIAHAHHELVKLNPECEDHWLDYAIAAKRAGNTKDCVMAHKKRMELCPRYKTTDAVRLLGYSSECSSTEELPPSTGLFEQCRDGNGSTYRPSLLARDFGRRIRTIFEEYQYTFSNCNIMISSLIGSPFNPNRIFSANSFFHHRHDLDTNGRQAVNGLEVLARLFLFGLALPLEVVETALDKDSVAFFFQAGLIRTSLACEINVVGEVQVYPAPSGFFQDERKEPCANCWFMTDWPMESLRLTRDAIMPVGYDTLELMSLSATLKPSQDSSILDLCCGCGIQGIFALLCNTERFNKLVCSDINERACRFAAANMALNIRQDEIECFAVSGDLFENVTGKFEFILSNPPFVAIPTSGYSPHIVPALYTVGGGVDGTELLQRIVTESVDYLEGDEASLLIVTELPNIESSCELIQRFLPDGTPASIRIAYVGHDVESVQQYAAIRQAETTSKAESRDWASAQIEGGILNRALALLSISSFGKGDETMLYQYGDGPEGEVGSDDSVGDLDEEDAFLTREGIDFTRARLL